MGVILERINDLHVLIVIRHVMAWLREQLERLQEVNEEVLVGGDESDVDIVFAGEGIFRGGW